MKKYLSFFIAFFLLLEPHSLFAQTSAAGSGALQSSRTGRTTRWQNWVFAGAIVVAATAGLTFVILNQGTNAE